MSLTTALGKMHGGGEEGPEILSEFILILTVATPLAAAVVTLAGEQGSGLRSWLVRVEFGVYECEGIERLGRSELGIGSLRMIAML